MEVEKDAAQIPLCNDNEELGDFSDIDSEEQRLSSYATRPGLYRKAMIALSIIPFLTLAIYFLISKSITSRTTVNQCGTSAAEARAKGCLFESTSFSWLPKECYDPETEEEFIKFVNNNDLNLYRDNNYTEKITAEEGLRGDGYGFFVHQEYHLVHCLFMIKKRSRGVAHDRKIDGYSYPLHHTEHCVDMLLEPPGFNKGQIQFSYIKWPYCGRPGGYSVEWDKLGRWTDY